MTSRPPRIVGVAALVVLLALAALVVKFGPAALDLLARLVFP